MDIGEDLSLADRSLFANIVHGMAIVFHPDVHECVTGFCLSECVDIQESFIDSTGFRPGVFKPCVALSSLDRDIQQSLCLECPQCIDFSTITFTSAKQILDKLRRGVTRELLTNHYTRLLADYHSSTCGLCKKQLLDVELPLWGRNTFCVDNHFYITDNMLTPLSCMHSEDERLSRVLRDPFALTLASVRPLYATSSHGCACAIACSTTLGDYLLSMYTPVLLKTRVPPAWVNYIPSRERRSEAHIVRLSPYFDVNNMVQ